MLRKIIFIASLFAVVFCLAFSQKRVKVHQPKMMYIDSSRMGVLFAKDPFVIRFQGRYLMYYPIPVYKDQSNPIKDWGVGIAESRDLYNWKKIGGVTPDGEHEKKGLATTCSVIIINKVDLFYQTYGNGTRDAICHAVAIDKIHL